MTGRFGAVLFDFGGVLTTSPFRAFERYEARAGLPHGFVRGLNAAAPDTNAWSRLERSEIDVDEFRRLFETEAEAAGGRVDALEVLACLQGELVPEMVAAVARLRAAGYGTALLTNNWAAFGTGPHAPDVLALFDVVVESSREGVRKPEPRFYEIACDRLGVDAGRAIFLDDLGVNLKPARAMGMTTVKVVDHDAALAALEALTGVPLR